MGRERTEYRCAVGKEVRSTGAHGLFRLANFLAQFSLSSNHSVSTSYSCSTNLHQRPRPMVRWGAIETLPNANSSVCCMHSSGGVENIRPMSCEIMRDLR